MKRTLHILLILLSLSLCAICIVQWVREEHLRGHILTLQNQLKAENTARIQAERKAAEYAREIERLEALRAEVEAKLLTVTEELGAISADSVARGYTLANFLAERMQTQERLAALENALGKGSEALQKHSTSVTAQNEAITRQNELLKKLVSERDSAIEKLNTRTREFNDLVEKYNKLGKSR
jgi:chromosome segregation ATPase